MELTTFRGKLRAILYPICFATIGMLVAFALKKIDPAMSKSIRSLIAFAVTSGSVLLLFPSVFGLPFGKVSIRDWLYRLGFGSAVPLGRFVLLGVLCAACTLGGMLVGTLLTGEYAFSADTITLGQALFTLTPGIWEEILFRGVLVLVLHHLTGSLKKAFWLQIAIFAAIHVKGLDPLSFIDAFSVGVITLAFTYCAWKTMSLIPGIIFHYLHDTFLFAVQLPEGVYTGVRDNALFYAGLWLSVGLCLWLVKLASEKHGCVAEQRLYPAS